MPRTTHYSRPHLRYIVAIVSLACGLYVSVAFSDRGWLVPSTENLFTTADLSEGDYDLQALDILNRALLRVKDNYVEPERIDPERMLAYALDAIQEEIPQVVARFDRGIDDHPTQVDLQVNEARRVFELGEINSLWEMSFRLREIFRYVQENLDDEEVDLRLVEYAAVNGMLDTLDPHSVLLSPEVFEDMQANNRGSFGGLGIVISIREGQLTIISPIDDTPAHRAGLRSGDQILKIGEESTINMSIDEAVGRLRGEPGTPVTVEILRDGWSLPHEFTLVREIINIESVKSEVLDAERGIGYVNVTNFQANTHDDLLMHLGRLRDEMGALNGLVLDLRDNPGGLLEQAIRVADTFLTEGTIVTTVGEGHRLREEKHAMEEGTEPFYPIVVLVNPGSASASEIVAGALQNNHRALIVGDRTFGKGSVQVLYEFDDGSALKLTIAQYLTPGDISIQSVGIVPDIQVVPMTISAETVDLFPNERVVREADLAAHLDSDHVLVGGTPDAVLSYYREPDPEPVEGEVAPIEPEVFEADFEITFAQRLLIASGTDWREEDMLAATTGTLTEIAAEQQVEVTRHLAELGIEWEEGESADLSSLRLAVTTDHIDNSVPAGQTLNVTVTVTNTGTRPAYRLRAVSESDYYVFDDREFVFGEVAPGESRSWTVPVEVAPEELTRTDRVSFALRADEEELAVVESAEVTVLGQPSPHFAFSYEILDDDGGNGDGMLQLGEHVTFRMTVSNVGMGDAAETLVYLKNNSDVAVLLGHGRETWEAMPRGTTRTVDFQFDVQHMPEGGMIRLEASVFDTVFRELTSRELELPLQPDGDLFEPNPGVVSVTAEQVSVLGGADSSSAVVAMAERGQALRRLGNLGDWIRVEWAPDHVGWLPASDVTVVDSTMPTTTLPAVYGYQPPLVVLNDSPLATDASSIRLSGLIEDDSTVSDYYIWVTGQHGDDDRNERAKVAYAAGDNHSVPVDQEIPLYPGINRISVIARDDTHMTSSAVVYVYRRTSGDTLSNAP